MEDIDGGLHPAVDGQSLDEDEDEGIVVSLCSVVLFCCGSGTMLLALLLCLPACLNLYLPACLSVCHMVWDR